MTPELLAEALAALGLTSEDVSALRRELRWSGTELMLDSTQRELRRNGEAPISLAPGRKLLRALDGCRHRQEVGPAQVEWVTVTEAHRKTGIPATTIRSRARGGRVNRKETSAGWLIDLADLIAKHEGKSGQ